MIKSIDKAVYALCIIPSLTAYGGQAYLGGSIAGSSARTANQSPAIVYNSGTRITDAYPLNKQQDTSALLSVNGGYEWAGSGQLPIIDLGLGLYTNLSNYHFNGKVVETALGDPSALLYHYQYHLYSTRLMAELQLAWLVKRFMPFVNVGIGPAWNRLDNYQETGAGSTGYPH